MLLLLQEDMVELVVGVLRFCPRDMNRDAEAVILLQSAVQPQVIMENGQVSARILSGASLGSLADHPRLQCNLFASTWFWCSSLGTQHAIVCCKQASLCACRRICKLKLLLVWHHQWQTHAEHTHCN